MPFVPGQLVALTSRWPKMRGSVTSRPFAKRVLPAEYTRTVLAGSLPAADSRQAASWATASRAAAEGATVSYVPISEMPTVPVLNPPACEPITARVTPPARPSQIRPYLSTRKL
jgi:hypothetical protein